MSALNFEKEAAARIKPKTLNGHGSALNGNGPQQDQDASPPPQEDVLMHQEGTSEQEAKFKQKQSTASSQSPVPKDYEKENGKIRKNYKNGKKGEKPKSGEDSAKKPKAPKQNPSQDLEDSQVEEGKEQEKSGRKVKKENRDHCNICRDGGNLLCCDNCPRSYHLHCLQLNEEELPDGDWYCFKCQQQINQCNTVGRSTISKRTSLEQERQKKLDEKQKKLEEKKELQDKARFLREQEFMRKREEKLKMKMQKEEEKRKLKEKSAEEVRIKLQQQTLNIKGTQSLNLSENKVELGEPLNEQERALLEESKENEGMIKAEKSKNEAGAAKKRREEKNELEKARDLKNLQIKKMFKLFSSSYPELVDKNSIKYPIEDSLIEKMPVLHGAENLPQKPEPRKVLIQGADFERLLYIWEFGNNFGDYLDLAPFKLEELQCALSLVKLDDLYGREEDMTWEEQQTLRAINEEGFELVNKLFIAFVATFMQDDQEKKSSENQSGQKEEIDPFIQAINNHIKNYQQVWPELARLIIQMKSEAEELDEKMKGLCDMLGRTTPETFTLMFQYDEKIEVLAHLIDLIHEQDDFRNFLNQRMEEKSQFNRQKMEVQMEIKQLETQKMEVHKEYAQNDQMAENELKLKEIEELQEKLATASRIEARKIHERINSLQAEKNKILKEKERIDDQISKKQLRIEKINEQAHKTSIKNQILGKDALKNEYWFFKEDSGKVLVKKLQDQPLDVEMEVDEGEEVQIMMDKEEPSYGWYYYDEEEQFNSLVDACNQKGIRERKLQDNLKRIAERMKLKKTKAKKAEEEKEGGDNKNEGKAAEEEKEEEKELWEEEKEEEKESVGESQSQSLSQESKEQRHWVFENDNFYNALQNAVWFGKKIPPKRTQGVMLRRNWANPVKASSQDERATLEAVKQNILTIEEYYQELGLTLSREWAPKPKRDELRQKILDSDSVKEISDHLLELDKGFSDPTALRFKEGKFESEEEEDDKMEQEEEKGEKEDKMIKRSRIQFFKYWPSKNLRQSWRSYLFNEVQDGSLNGLYISVKILEKVNEQYVQRQFENQEKKNRKNGKVQAQAVLNNRRQIGRMEKKTDYKEYFESSSEGENSSEEEEEGKKAGRPSKKKNEEQSDDEESDSDDEDQDDKCYICNKLKGEVMCCEGCSHVAHLLCTSLKKVPSGDWHCDDCLVKMSQRRTTRNQVQVQSQRQLRGSRR